MGQETLHYEVTHSPISPEELAVLRGEGGPEYERLLSAEALVKAALAKSDAPVEIISATAEKPADPSPTQLEYVVSAAGSLMHHRAEAQQNGLYAQRR